ncbi:MAG: hypothetical protein E5299_00924 [Burkholderia gladioli]|nr:MAG: hypothetical protein E5299_00924 [Burkholderia gladioli]
MASTGMISGNTNKFQKSKGRHVADDADSQAPEVACEAM